MKKNNGETKSATTLRLKAEELLKVRGLNSLNHLTNKSSEADTLILVHELEVHQIELELMNEDLSNSKIKAQEVANKYTELYDFAPTAYFTFSPEGEIIELNLLAAQMLNKDRESLINRRFSFFLEKESLFTFNHFLRIIFQSKIKNSCELVLLHDGGNEMNVHLTGIINDNGANCLVTATDITELTLSLKSLQESEEKYRLLAEHMNDVVWLMDLDFKIFYLSPSSEKLRGFTNEELIDMPVQQSMEPESYKLALEYFHKELPRILSDPDYYPIILLELEYNCKDGATVWLENKFSIIRDEKSISIMGEGRDISDRKHAEDKLKISLTLLEATLESIHNGILVVSSEGKVIKSNAKFAQIWNIPDDVLSAGDDKELLDYVLNQLTDPQEFIAKVNELYNKPESETVDLVFFRDGRIFERISKPMHVNGTPQGRVWSFLDITEQRLLVDQLLQVNAEKDKFFSIIAHDLRSPFNVFLGYTELLVEEMDTMTLKEIQRIAMNLRGSASNLFGLLENLLEWSAVRRGITTFIPETIILLPAITKSIESVISIATKKGIEIRCEIPEEIEIVADKNMLETTVRNLVSNSLKFTNNGGFVTISAKPAGEKSVEVSIKDTGIGMNPELMSNLFRLDKKTNRTGTGGEPSTGLGLNICKEFIEKHGGKLWVESEEGKGSTFRFTMPS